ncbi:hypothetical protein Q9R46_00555 [Paenibacillus sp. RRE4]|uniref:hypothetical protein n=1 Tax=Paenibacillus sp. RRE4 TaxID=2962587 RepID=UPI00288285F3|nr:hypothetical protein [Paenibacillus sp. RRE4]MDT0121115.1 hypothetical protein [Paenibacillus sp. RRE4]
MSNLHIEETSQEETRLYEELRRALQGIPQGKEREQAMRRMIRQLKSANWRNARLNGLKQYGRDARPVKLWIWIAAGALAPVVFFCLFIWASLWVE